MQQAARGMDLLYNQMLNNGTAFYGRNSLTTAPPKR